MFLSLRSRFSSASSSKKYQKLNSSQESLNGYQSFRSPLLQAEPQHPAEPSQSTLLRSREWLGTTFDQRGVPTAWNETQIFLRNQKQAKEGGESGSLDGSGISAWKGHHIPFQVNGAWEKCQDSNILKGWFRKIHTSQGKQCARARGAVVVYSFRLDLDTMDMQLSSPVANGRLTVIKNLQQECHIQ